MLDTPDAAGLGASVDAGIGPVGPVRCERPVMLLEGQVGAAFFQGEECLDWVVVEPRDFGTARLCVGVVLTEEIWRGFR